MLSAQAYSFRQNSRLAISLSWIGGFVNVVVLLSCGQVISHVTGTTTFLGKALGQFDWEVARFSGFVLLCFLTGAAASACATEWARRRAVRSKYVLPIAIETILLALVAVSVSRHHHVDSYDLPELFWITGLASAAMGLQNATITKISGSVVRTTHLTGVMTDIGLEGVQLLLYYRDSLRGRWAQRAGRVAVVSRRHPSFLRVLLLISIFLSFTTGVVAGTFVFSRFPTEALLPPVAFLIFIIIIDLRKPIAGLAELDVLNDPELAAQGIVRSMLPPSVGIYRFAGGAAGSAHRAPSFEAWADRLPDHWRVVILAITRHTRFNEASVRDLIQAITRLDRQGRKLILSGVTPTQFKALDSLHVGRYLDMKNLCPDIEFAIVRALALVQELDGHEKGAAAGAKPTSGQPAK